jgi:hypothetical protein
VKHLEHEHQKALIAWAQRTRLPAAADVKPGSTIGHYLLAIPNGGKRSSPREGARLRAEGVKPGVSDLLLPLRRQQAAGLWIELKAPGNTPTALQAEWIERMELAGYCSTWRDSWIKAAELIAWYVGVKAPLQGGR